MMVFHRFFGADKIENQQILNNLDEDFMEGISHIVEDAAKEIEYLIDITPNVYQVAFSC